MIKWVCDDQWTCLAIVVSLRLFVILLDDVSKASHTMTQLPLRPYKHDEGNRSQDSLPSSYTGNETEGGTSDKCSTEELRTQISCGRGPTSTAQPETSNQEVPEAKQTAPTAPCGPVKQLVPDPLVETAWRRKKNGGKAQRETQPLSARAPSHG